MCDRRNVRAHPFECVFVCVCVVVSLHICVCASRMAESILM